MYRCIYIFISLLSSLLSVFFNSQLLLSLKGKFFRRLLSSLGSFGNLVIRISTDPHRNICEVGIQLVVCPNHQPCEFSPCIFLSLKKFMMGENLHKKFILLELGFLPQCFYQNLNCCQYLNKRSVEMKQINYFGQ